MIRYSDLIKFGIELGMYKKIYFVDEICSCYEFSDYKEDFRKTPYKYLVFVNGEKDLYTFNDKSKAFEKIFEIIKSKNIKSKNNICFQMFYNDGTDRFFTTTLENFKYQIMIMINKNSLEVYFPNSVEILYFLFGMIDGEEIEKLINDMLENSRNDGRKLKLVKVKYLKTDE